MTVITDFAIHKFYMRTHIYHMISFVPSDKDLFIREKSCPEPIAWQNIVWDYNWVYVCP